jgi:hypothetical protein
MQYEFEMLHIPTVPVPLPCQQEITGTTLLQLARLQQVVFDPARQEVWHEYISAPVDWSVYISIAYFDQFLIKLI